MTFGGISHLHTPHSDKTELTKIKAQVAFCFCGEHQHLASGLSRLTRSREVSPVRGECSLPDSCLDLCV